jgi:hypothetical protein
MNNKDINKRIEEINKNIDFLRFIVKSKMENFDFNKPYEEFSNLVKDEQNKIMELDREKRMIQPYHLTDNISDSGDVMSLSIFINFCKSGCFIDYDGSGFYIKNGKMTNISIYPSDVMCNSIRKEFDTIIWFNR